MIQLLSEKYKQTIAYFLFLVFYLSTASQTFAKGGGGNAVRSSGRPATALPLFRTGTVDDSLRYLPKKIKGGQRDLVANPKVIIPMSPKFIGGPSQPEMTSFKPVGTDNMVNLFSGDFNYNIPLLDVGGYPVNIYYDGNISMEQEASWVGLGWNINPGNVNRNMRGIPDDFDGTDTLVEEQMMKPNKTWGLRAGGSVEFIGIGLHLGANLGVSFNNYLGPAMDLDVSGGIGIDMAKKATSEKSPFSLNATLGADISSRDGVTLSPSVSFSANSFVQNTKTSNGIGLSTGFNSRSGIKALQLSEQSSFNYTHAKPKAGTSSYSEDLFSTSITFAKPSYMPTMRMPLTNTSWSANVQGGGGLSGLYLAGQLEMYCQQSEIAPADNKQYKPMVGYLYYQNAVNNPNAVMDFTRFNDKEVTPNTPIVSAPQYSYDVFSIQGEGTGGSIRAYRNDIGSVRDNFTKSQDGSLSFGFDAGPPGHYGLNFNTIQTPSYISEWQSGNKLHSSATFGSASGLHENVYFRNPGENCVLDPNQYNKIGNTDLVRFALGGTSSSPMIEPVLQHFDRFGNATSITNVDTASGSVSRAKRTQVTSFLTAGEAALIGLDRSINSYNSHVIFDTNNNLTFDAIPRVGGYRKGHHISQINVTESDGKRYVYGIPVYNTKQKDFTFSIVNTSGGADADTVAVSNTNWMTTGSSLISSGDKTVDGYVQITSTPAYTHSFLLSGLLSPDYVDVTGNGISDDDLGEAVKFNYTLVTDNSNNPVIHKWRTPLTPDNAGNFNAGNRTETKDDKAIVSYGERESWYVHSIESKTMIAIFTLAARHDGKGPVDSSGGINANDSSERCLKQIDLYNKADIKANGFANAKPVKTVHFSYSYALCKKTPDNLIPGEGKLTLDSIYFTFNGQNRANKNKYAFSYVDSSGKGNPSYVLNASDRWNAYKPASMNPGGLKNKDFPYSIQDTTKKATIDSNAAAWTLKKILLPSGGQIEIQYEADDYAYVQNLRAAQMMQVAGFGFSPDYSTKSAQLYGYDFLHFTSNDAYYVFINVPVACSGAAQVQQYYLDGIGQLAFKYAVQMPKGTEYISSYATISSYGVTSNPNIIWLQLSPEGGHSPLLMSALEYLRTQLPGQAFPGYDVSDASGLEQVGDMLVGMFDGLKNIFTGPIQAMINAGDAQNVDLTKCFVRLNNPTGKKYGGGSRVKEILLKDNWKVMARQYTSVYGQTYDYTTTENFFGTQRTISSGVASYEPAIGGEENPFQTIVQVVDNLPLGPASYGSVEMPVLDAFFPAPGIGYSKVTVRSLPNPFVTPNQKSRSGIGKQVTEFYTAKDYPVYYSNTDLDGESDMEEHDPATTSFLYKYAFDSRALSQGFLVANNDMHGKMKSQSSYAENDSATRINYTQNFYRNTGAAGMTEQFYFASAAQGGAVRAGNMGIDVELMTDTREFDLKSHSTEIQGQLDWFPELLFLGWLPFIYPVVGESENAYKAVTATKVISYHAVLDSVIVIDKGSQVSTKNLVYDAETGMPLVTRTNNEFNQPVYNTSYPAYWAYSGMGPAYKNIDVVYSAANFSNGKINTTSGAQITPAPVDTTVFESGDELLILGQTNPSGCDGTIMSSGINKVWAFDTAKNTGTLTNPNPYFVFVDSTGRPYTSANVSFRIVRSGKRNMLNAQAATVTSMASPFSGPISSDTARLLINDSSRVLNASATEYKEKWQADDDILNTYVTEITGCDSISVVNCTGYLERQINPYRKGLLGNFRAWRNMVFYDQRSENNIAPSSTPSSLTTNLPQNGFLNTFNLYWNFNNLYNLVPNVQSTQWVWNNQSTRINARGLELETKNALNIYTAAQYGYAKSLPTSIVNNAAYGQTFYDGFEDYNYTGAINGEVDSVCRNKKYVDFSLNAVTGDMQNSHVINADTAGFNAHTGKYVVAVDAGDSASKTFSVATGNNNDFNLKFGLYQARALYVLGGNDTLYSGDPTNVINSSSDTVFNFTGSSPYVNITVNPTSKISGSTYSHNYDLLWSFYIQITEAKQYFFSLGLSTHYSGFSPNHSNGMFVQIYDMNDHVMKHSSTLSEGATDQTLLGNTMTDSTFLCPGIYHIKGSVSESYQTSGNPNTSPGNNYIWQCTSATGASADYKSLSLDNSCPPVTTAIPGNDSMLNPVFTVPDTTKMVFSTWVHQTCGNLKDSIPCAETSFDSNHVSLQFLNYGSVVNQHYYNSLGQLAQANDTALVILKPAGPIIDGWQRYEGYFMAPATATNMTMSFVNKSASRVYFDDIRVFPYNADMKSYIYDPVSLRLTGQLDANNYASFYEYDEEGTLIRTKAETIQGIKTINETRSAKQRVITAVQ